MRLVSALASVFGVENTEADFDRVIDANRKSAFFTVTEVRPLLADG